MKKSDVVIPPSQQAWYDRFHVAPAAWTRDLLLCTGQIGIGPDGRVIVDPEAQITAAFEGLRAVLNEAGLGFGDVVEITTFHVAPAMDHFSTFVRVKDRYLTEPYPAWTAIAVPELVAAPGGLVEVRATARRRNGPARAMSTRPSPKRKSATKVTRRRTVRRRDA